MGVQGLTSLVEENKRHIYQDVNFRNTKLVIDGCNLYHLLYFDNGLDQSHGGDYDLFACLVDRFFKALRDCDIDPYVVLDGGSDYTDKKLVTLRKRAQDKIQKAHKVSIGLQENVLPALIKDVFKQVLFSLKVPFAQCIGEADQEIASLASQWNCPVLSDDSDFYVFDLPAGFLPISHFRWKEISAHQSNSQRYIPSQHFTTANFCAHFKLNRQLLPVFAAMAGNDYIKLHDMGLTIQWADYSEVSGRFSHLDGLLRWLSGFQKQHQALEAFLTLIDNGDRPKLAAASRGLSLGIEEYTVLPSCLARFFDRGVPFTCLPEPLRVLPDWTLLPFTEGRLTSVVVDALVLRRVSQSAYVEDTRLPSGNATSRPIRQILYGLLLGVRRGDRQSLELAGKLTVEEYDREGRELVSLKVELALPSTAGQLQLDTLDRAPQSIRLMTLLETLGVTQCILKIVPPHLRCPVSSTCYWWTHSHPQPDRHLLQALLLGMVYGELCRQKRETGQREDEPVFSKLSQLIQGGRKGLDRKVAHAYSQWQCCLRDSLHLNQLLCLPLADPHCAWLYKGTLVHQLVVKLRGGATPDSLLIGSPSSKKLYRSMLKVVQSQKRATEVIRQQSAVASPRQPPLDIMTMDLHMLALEQDEDNDGAGRKTKPEEDQGYELVSVRTRYKRARNPLLSRQRGRSGWD